MNNRTFLIAAVSSLFACLFLAFAWIFFNGVFSKPNSSVANDKVVEVFESVPVGEAVVRRYKNKAVWVVHLSSKQIVDVKLANDYVIAPKQGCDLTRLYCVLEANTERDGVKLQFTYNEPPQLESGTPWFGGFVDPSNGSIYDLIGRAYKQNKDQSNKVIKQLVLQ